MTDPDQMNCALSQARPEILCVPLDTDLHRCPLSTRNPEDWSSSVQLERSVSDSAMKLSLRFAVAETSLWPTTQQEPKKDLWLVLSPSALPASCWTVALSHNTFQTPSYEKSPI